MRRNTQLGSLLAGVAAAGVLVAVAGAGTRPTGTALLHVKTNGIVTASHGHVTCANACSLHFRRGALVKLHALPRPHFRFAGWSGACVGGAPTCVLALDGPRAVRAVFIGEPQEVELAVSGPGAVVSRPSGLACGRGPCTATFPWGTSLRLAAEPGRDGKLLQWGGACANAGTSACTLVVRSDVFDVTAAFGHATPAPDPQRLTVVLLRSTSSFRVASTPPGITCPTDCEASFPSGATVVLRANSYSPEWSGGCSVDESDECSLIVDGPTRVLVFPHFPMPAPPQYGVSVTVAGKGTVAAPGIKCGSAETTLLDCQSLFSRHASVVLEARPGKGSTFAGWNQFCTGKKPSCRLLMVAPMTVGAVFRTKSR